MTTQHSNINSSNTHNSENNIIPGQSSDAIQQAEQPGETSANLSRSRRSRPYRNPTPSRSTLWRRQHRPGPGVRGPDRSLRRRGREHGNWIHGEGHSRNMDSPEYRAWQEGVYARCSFCCVLTGATSDLVCHHLNGWNISPEERYSISNGVVLSRTVHNQFHTVYGAGNNTIGQFADFIENYYNGQCSVTLYGNHDPSLTTEQFLEDRASRSQRLHEKLLVKIAGRHHELKEGVYETNKSPIKVRCKIHDQVFYTTAGKYKKAAFGVPCCMHARQARRYDEELRAYLTQQPPGGPFCG